MSLAREKSSIAAEAKDALAQLLVDVRQKLREIDPGLTEEGTRFSPSELRGVDGPPPEWKDRVTAAF